MLTATLHCSTLGPGGQGQKRGRIEGGGGGDIAQGLNLYDHVIMDGED